MIIFLYGQDSYRINQKLKEIISGYKAKNPSGFNSVNFDLADGKIEDFFEAVKSSSLIPEKKLIIAKNIFSIKNQSEPILKFLKTQNKVSEENIILVITHFGDSSKNKLFEYLTNKPNQFQNFKLLKDYEVKDWAKKFLNSFDIVLTGEALDFLISNYSCDLWRLNSEIKKLADFKIKGVVSKSQVEELVVSNREHNIFELTDALLRKNKIKALKALHIVIDGGEKPTELLGLLAWQVRNLLRFKTGATPSQLKLHPFVLGKLKESEKTFPVEELNAFLSKIIDLDLAFKTTDINEKTALSLLISEI
ncbi:MAG: DNA polymerase III subunit delta [Parcubacteria group bacterium]|nr:DNA polymerase III subunit delta [Parcubacteria group bacterium]